VAFIRKTAGGAPQVAVVDLDGKNLREVTRLPGACARVA